MLGSQIQRIVLIADNVDFTFNELTIYNRNLDKPNRFYVDQLFNALGDLGCETIYYDSPQRFLSKLHSHKNDLVFPYWFGENSRNRHSLIPSICEASNIRFVGADAYTKIVCNDKHLSKLLCNEVGLKTPKSQIWNSHLDKDLLSLLQYPCVVKPNFEGTSLGIGEENLVQNIDDAILMANKLYREFNQPILIEEFVIGKEVSICIIGSNGEIKTWAAAERYVKADDGFFINHLYTFKEKKAEDYSLALRNIQSEISKDTIINCKKLFKYLDKVEFMRIDGRLNEKDFSIIELTPETHLGDDCEFCGTFIASGEYSYPEIVRLLIENSLEGYQNQSANKLYEPDNTPG